MFSYGIRLVTACVNSSVVTGENEISKDSMFAEISRSNYCILDIAPFKIDLRRISFDYQIATVVSELIKRVSIKWECYA